MLLPRVPGPPAQPWGRPRPPRAESSPPPPGGATWRGDTSHTPAPNLVGSILPMSPPAPGPPLDPPGSPLCSASWTPRSSLVRSWAPPSTPERASSPEALPSPARVGGCIPEGWGVSGMGGAWCERCCVWSWCWKGGGGGREQSRGVRGQRGGGMMGGGWKGVGLPGYPQANGGGSASHSLPPPGSGGALPSDPSHTHSTVVSREWWGHKDGGNPPPTAPRAQHPHTPLPATLPAPLLLFGPHCSLAVLPHGSGGAVGTPKVGVRSPGTAPPSPAGAQQGGWGVGGGQRVDVPRWPRSGRS